MTKTRGVCAVIALGGIGMLASVPALANSFVLSNLTSESCGGTYCVNVSSHPVLVEHSVPISEGYSVTNSFNVSGPSSIFRGVIVYWGEVPAQIDWAITTEPFGGTTISSGSQGISSPYEAAPGMFFLGFDMHGFLSEGTYWLQIADEMGLGGWEVCNGPSRAFANDHGTLTEIPSETFTLTGSQVSVLAPEPPMLLPMGLSMLALVRYAFHRTVN